MSWNNGLSYKVKRRIYPDSGVCNMKCLQKLLSFTREKWMKFICILITSSGFFSVSLLQWPHMGVHMGVWNHQEFDCLFNSLFWLAIKKAKIWVMDFCERNSLDTSGFPALTAGKADSTHDVIMQRPCVSKLHCSSTAATWTIPDSKVHGANMGPTGPRWAPCWPHELCYLRCVLP